MSVARLGLDHPDAIPRMLRAWDAGQDTAGIAAFLGVDEAEVVAILTEERQVRRWRREAAETRLARLAQAWAGDDIDRREVAARFGYPSAHAAANALWRYRGPTRPNRPPVTAAERERMRALRRRQTSIAEIVHATGRSASAVRACVKGIPYRAPSYRVPDLPRLRRIVVANAAADIGTRGDLAARFGHAHRKSFSGVAAYARRVLAGAPA